MTQIYYLPDDRLVEVEDSEVILEASLRAEIPHTHICGGNARCSTCRVMILDGLEYCAPRTPQEQMVAEHLNFSPALRLACQTQLVGNGKVTLRRLALDAEDVEVMHEQITDHLGWSGIGEERELAILFSDIRGFTSFSESLPPYDVIYVLNRYFNHMGRVIERHGGTINNYMGDGLMALFGLKHSDHAAERAVRAALDMADEMTKLNPYLDMLYHHNLQIGIGVHYGHVVLGAVGASHNKRVTAIGDAVNFASRIEAMNKQSGTTLLISESTYLQIQDQAIADQPIQVEIAGKSGQYYLYAVTEMRSPPSYSLGQSSLVSGAQPLLALLHKLLHFLPLPTLWKALLVRLERFLVAVRRV